MSLDRNAVYRNLFAMDTIVHSLSDEDLMEGWLMNHVPDGCNSVQDIEDNYSYMTDEELAEEYEGTAKYFACLVKEATMDGYDKWTSVGSMPLPKQTEPPKPKYRRGQTVRLSHTQVFQDGNKTFTVEPDVKFIVMESRVHIFNPELTVYSILNENVGQIAVDERDITEGA